MSTITPAADTRSVLRASWRNWLQWGAPRAGSAWLQLLWTFLFAVVLAIGFTLLGIALHADTLSEWFDLRTWALWYGRNLVVSLTIGCIIQGLYMLARATIGVPRILALVGWQRAVFFSGLPLLGVAVGWPIGVSMIYGDLHVLAGLTPAHMLSMVVLTTMISSLIFLYFSMRTRQIKAEMRANEAQLQLLQGQMEPHFLFNTLANVISLIDADAPRAKQMLEGLTDYLRASLGSLRQADSTLGAELELAVRYLQLMQVRMGERLRFEIAVDPALRKAALAPLMLQPLVENAVKHGLEPQVDGGTVRVRAALLREGGRDTLEICVEDDGVGLEAASRRAPRTVAGGPDGHGVAIENLRERLRSRFGMEARLTLDGHEPSAGTLACLRLPYATAAQARAAAVQRQA